MKKLSSALIVLIIALICFSGKVLPQSIEELKINPLQLITLKEVRNITKVLGNELFPGYEFSKIPSLIYRPNVQELLINYPHQPKGFSIYKGFNPLSNETIYVRNDTTTFKIDDQNTSTMIEDVEVLAVADYYSSMRGLIRDVVINRDKDFISSWLDKWSFIPSPYNNINMLLHEGFHVYQTKKAPDKFANENIVSKYPLLDPVNNTLWAIEGNILRDAILTESKKLKDEKIKEFSAIRSYRQSLLKKEITDYENLNEYVEGLAKYIEYKFLLSGENVQPIKEMYYQNGFNGYKGILPAMFKKEIEEVVKIVSVSDNRFGNKYGTGPMRFRLYFSGACIALLLDETMPEWKEKIFDSSVYLCDLLKSSVNLSEAEIANYVEKSKSEYNYEKIFNEKKVFESEGKSKIQEKLDAILKTQNTLITISYSAYERIMGMAYTPFGVSQVSDNASIYDLVPLKILFSKEKIITFKKVKPVYIDKSKKEISFEISNPIQNPESLTGNNIDTDDFNLANMEFEIKTESNKILIQLK